MRERETSDRNGKLDDKKDEKNNDVEKQTDLKRKIKPTFWTICVKGLNLT